MPIYAYRCAACGHTKDVLQKITDPVLTTCPACGGHSFAKQLTAPGFQLKGSGWYATDFKGGGKPADKPADGSADKAADAGKSEPSAPASTGDGKSVASAGGCGSSCACH